MTTKTRNLLTQVIFWIAFFLYNVLDEVFYSDLIESLVVSFFLSATVAILVYVNILWLIPKYLYRKKYLQYLIMLSAYTVVFVYVNLILDQSFNTDINQLIFDVIQILLMVGGISSIWILVEQVRTKEKLAKIEKEQIVTDLKFLKAQTNPHFLFNVLNNIHFLIKKDANKASEILIKLSDMLRYQLYETNTKRVCIGKEIEHLKNYVELERIRVGNRLSYDSNIVCTDNSIEIEPFLLLPLIENAFKHSLSTEKGFVSIGLQVDSEELSLTVENSIPNTVEKKKSSGLGIPTLKQRLELLYPGKHDIQYGIVKSNFVAQLKINLVSNSENTNSLNQVV